MEAGSTMILCPHISHLDGGLINNKELPYLSSSCHDRFWLLNMTTRLELTVAHKGFIHEPKVVPHKAVDSNIGGTRSSVEHKDESIEKNNNNSLGIRNGRDDDCSKCCDTMQNGKSTFDSVRIENDTCQAVNVLSVDHTAQDSSLQNSS
jgi:hypothetical protein